MQDNIMLKGVIQSESDKIHRVIGNTFIVDYGIIKEIDAEHEGIVTVEMLVAQDNESIIITKCVLASFASQSVTFNIKPKVGDKVMVLFPRHFSSKMFNEESTETIVNASCSGYTLLGGIAVLLNRFQKNIHKNYIEFAEGSVELKLAYSSGTDKNLFTLDISKDGEFTVKSNAVEISADKQNEITVTNGKATVTIDKDGNVKVETSGKYTIKNNTTDLKQVLDGLAMTISSLTTTGTATSQQASTATQASVAEWQLSKLNTLFA